MFNGVPLPFSRSALRKCIWDKPGLPAMSRVNLKSRPLVGFGVVPPSIDIPRSIVPRRSCGGQNVEITETPFMHSKDMFGVLPRTPPWKLKPDLLIVVTLTLNDTRITDRKSTRLNSSHGSISYAVFCLKKKKKKK